MKTVQAAFNAACRDYKKVFTDEHLIESIVEVVGDVLGTFPDGPLGIFYTVGDVRKIKGFYKSEWLVNDLAACMIGRAFRGLVQYHGLNPADENLILPCLRFLHLTDEQQTRIVPKIIKKCIEKYGDVELDKGAIEAIQMRYEVPGNN